MRVEAYIIGWNREDTIAFTIRHYKAFCDTVYLYDNFSTDRTRDVAEAHGATVRLFGISGILDDAEYLKVKNNAWKGSSADWVIVVDEDEILWSPDLVFILRQAITSGSTIFNPRGVSIHSDSMPKDDWLDIQTGRWDKNYSKTCVFDPKAIKEIGYVEGCHVSKPRGRMIYSSMPLYLLHYRSVGGVDRLIKRHNEYVPRMSQRNRTWGMGIQYFDSEAHKRREWKEHLEKSQTFSSLGIG